MSSQLLSEISRSIDTCWLFGDISSFHIPHPYPHQLLEHYQALSTLHEQLYGLLVYDYNSYSYPHSFYYDYPQEQYKKFPPHEDQNLSVAEEWLGEWSSVAEHSIPGLTRPFQFLTKPTAIDFCLHTKKTKWLNLGYYASPPPQGY